MKAGEMAEKLEDLIQQYGDLDVLQFRDDETYDAHDVIFNEDNYFLII